MCKDKLRYLALGDCLTKGPLALFLDGFAYRFCRFLSCTHRCVNCRNLGRFGLKSWGLLRQLKCDREVKYAVKEADIITISIGGNNILRSASNNYTCINKRIAHEGIEYFREDWPKILYNIRNTLCSEAEVYVMNLYNPYCPNDPNYEIADYFICELNSIIEDRRLINIYSYNVVDVYCKFERNKDKEWTFFQNIFFRDPHPNWEGNQQIFLAFKEAYCEED
jgi:hypothetical protein